ncbi:MAG TPA: serine/threonine-protein kinase, partial [Polyangiaceae bacterium]|nr:serine/threonine-protein kinase [Polyangiaceae bacterium]
MSGSTKSSGEPAGGPLLTGISEGSLGADSEAADVEESFLREVARIPAAAPPPLEGRVIAGRYELRALLGRGAHGEVWEALDSLARESVAVKLLRPRAGAQAARVRREVAALRLLRLPGVVRLLDEGVDEGRVFLVMEKVVGDPFPGAATPCPWQAIAGVTVALIETLARVHAAGVIHRDLKPANILVRDDGCPSILDFGLSYLGSPLGEGLTESGQMLGTPAFLAPEQITGSPVTVRTDLYAVGAMLYLALSGRLPHEAEDLATLLRARLARVPDPLKDLVPGAPPAVAAVVDQLLAMDPNERPRSAAEVLDRLRGSRLFTTKAIRRLGSSEPVLAVLDAASRGRSVDLRGPPGSGRTRCLEEAAVALAREGREVLWTTAAKAPFASLERVVGSLEGYDRASLAEIALHVERRLRAALQGGAVLLVDDAERIDSTSAAVIERCLDRGALGAEANAGANAGAIVRAFADALGAPLDPEAVILKPLDEEALQSLFAGPDRLLHLREDAARTLWARTGGLPARVTHEITAWVHAGLTRWDSDRLVVDRDALDTLEAGLRLAPPLRLGHPGASPAELSPRLSNLLAWIALASPHGDVDRLSAAMAEPLWRVEAEVSELVARGAARILPDGCLEPCVTPTADEAWPPERRGYAHRAIAAALQPGTVGRLWHLLAGAEELDPAHASAVANEGLAVAARLAREGHLGRAIVPLSEALRAARRVPLGMQGEIASLLALWAEIALAEGTPQALDRLLYELCRPGPRIAEVEPIEGLARAALAVSSWTPRGLALVCAVRPFTSLGLERRRRGLLMLAARRVSQAREEEVITDLAAWAEASGEAAARATLAVWLGRLRYRQGRFEEAAALHAQAAEGQAWITERTAARLDGASALMEAFQHEEALAQAREALVLARGCRHAFYEGRAEWLLRSIAYRTGVTDGAGPDGELVEAVARLGVAELLALVALNEAAVAFRAGDLGAARDLAGRARRLWIENGQPLGP